MDKGRLSQEDIDRMVQDAERFAKEDSELRTTIESRNSLENYIYGMRSSIDGFKNKLSDEDVKVLEETVQQTILWLDENQNETKENI